MFMWLLYRYGYNDAGTLGALSMGVLTNIAWRKGWPGALSLGHGPTYSADAERFLGRFWKWIAQPLLFGSIGSGCVALSCSPFVPLELPHPSPL